MEYNINYILLQTDHASKGLVDLITQNEGDVNFSDAIIYHNFPFYLNDDGSIAVINILIISKKHGLLIVKCYDITDRSIDDTSVDSIVNDIEQNYSLIYSKLLKIKNLRKNPNELRIKVHPCIYFLNKVNIEDKMNDYWSDIIVFNDGVEFVPKINAIEIDQPYSDDLIKEVVSSLEGSRTITKIKERNTTDTLSKGKILDKIESEIALFDLEQKRAALFTLDSAQRIRGLAGSGKTIILTMKAALMHLQHPDAKILYTFYTKSLYSQIKLLITRFYRQYAEKDPNWDNIHILHAWGGRNLPGVYYNTCLDNGIAPITYKQVMNEKDAFDNICKRLYKENLKSKYDYSLLDEGQDFPVYFYRICRKITKNNRVIWAYDECQNIFDIDIQNTNLTFDKDESGQYYIDFTNINANDFKDLVLHKCYRNPRKILVTAFALGFGIYSDRIIQMLENNEHWNDLGFEVVKGNSKIGDKMVIDRPLKNSPLLKNKYLDDDCVSINIFNTIDDEIQYIVKMIEKDISDNLRPDDVLVISLDDRNARKYFADIQQLLNKKDISSYNILDAPSTTKEFFLKDHVTLTTVYRAKGNEAGSVYVVGVDSVYFKKYDINERNKLFVSITRANAWVHITGVGQDALLCKNEIDIAMSKYPYLEFTMPDRNKIKVYQRDLAKSQEDLNKIERQLDEISTKTGMSKQQLIEKILNKPKK